MSTRVIDKATSHYRTKISGEMKSITVPEWDTKIWFKESNTLREEAKLVELAQQGKTVEALVETLITKARNEDGSKMFTLAEKATFMNEVDPAVVIRICSEMNALNAESNVEIAEKN